jgi:hypothetical protein
MAIYGEAVADNSPTVAPYHPRPLPTVEPTPLVSALDPAIERDPTRLAQSLLKLIVHSFPPPPTLPVIIRLMFSLKPASDDWELPDFPYIYPNLEEASDFDIQHAAQITNRPVPDDISYETLERFAERVANAVGPKVRLQSSRFADLTYVTVHQSSL